MARGDMKIADEDRGRIGIGDDGKSLPVYKMSDHVIGPRAYFIGDEGGG
jgi:hypothetical protein